MEGGFFRVILAGLIVIILFGADMKYLMLITCMLTGLAAMGQRGVVDKIVAVVGEEIVLMSDVENELMHLMQSQGNVGNTVDLRDEVFENQLVQKLLLAQAKVDSVMVTDAEVESQLNAQLEFYVQQTGSEEQLERYFGKSMLEIKNDMRPYMRNNMITQRMQAKIVENVRVTPSEVRFFYRGVNRDSLVDVPAKYEIQQIVVRPRVSDTEKERVRARLREFREQIQEGKQTFATLAVLYSEDQGSAVRGGELGYKAKGDFVPEFAEEAFGLKPGQLSKIVETEYGFHLIQCVDRQGDRMNLRHILLRPKVAEEERREAIEALDSIRMFVETGELTFEEAARYFSADKQTRQNGGLLADENADSRLPKDKIRDAMAVEVNRLEVGEMSEPFVDRSSGQEEYKIIRVKAFYPQHKANLEDDWTYFEGMLRAERQQEVFLKWIRERQANTYIHVDEAYRDGRFRYGGWIK